MLRSAGKVVGTAAGVAASGPASQSQCRAQQPRRSAQYGKEDTYKAINGATTLQKPEEEVDADWQFADFRGDGEQVIFNPEEINDTLNSVVAFASGSSGKRRTVTPQSGTSARISEIDGDSDSGSEGQESSIASLHIQAAEMQLAAPEAIKEDFTRALNKLLLNPGVQTACVQALKNDPSFSRLLTSPQASLDIPVEKFSLLPAAAQQAAQEEQDPASSANNLAQGLIRLGEMIKQKAAGVRDALGGILVSLGFRVHALLGRPFGSTPLEDADPERAQRRAEAVGNALVTIACAVLALVLVKRVHRIRFV